MVRATQLAVAAAWACMASTGTAGTIVVLNAGVATTTSCTLAQAIDAANRANNGAGSYGSTPSGATTVDPLRYSVARHVGSGTCSGATGGANTISLQNFAGQTILFEANASMYPNQGWNDAVADRADNYWYGPNALPPIASTIIIEGHGATLKIADGTRRLRFFFVGANPRNDNLNDLGEAVTPGYNTPGAGNLTLRNLALTGGRQRGGGSAQIAGGGAGLGGAIYNQGRVRIEASLLHGNRADGGMATLMPVSALRYSGGGMAGDGSEFLGGGMGGPVPNGNGDPGGPALSGFPSSAKGGGSQNGLGAASRTTPGNGAYVLGGNGGGGGGYFTDSSGHGGGGAGFRGGSGGMGSIGHNPDATLSGGDFGKGGGRLGGGGVGGGGGGGSLFIYAGGGFGGGGGYNVMLEIGGFGGFGGGTGGTYPSITSFGGGFGGGDSAGAKAGGGAGMGGAIFNHFGDTVLVNSTLTGNLAAGGEAVTPAGAGHGLGGAIFNLNGSLTLTHATVAGNAVSGSTYNGGAIYSISYNGEDLPAGHPDHTGSHLASVNLQRSVLAYSTLAGTTTPVNDLVSHRPDTVATGQTNMGIAVVGQSHSLVTRSAAIGFHGDFQSTWLTTDPVLGPLAANGGPTLTMRPGEGSPAFDAIPTANCTATSTDQRGVGRPIGSGCDIGAVEAEGVILVTTQSDSTLTNGQCSLREALDNANTASAVHSDCRGGNTFSNLVRFAPSVSTITLAMGVAGIFSNVMVDGDRNGDGVPDVTIDAHDASAIFVLGNGKTINLNGLNLIEGNAGSHAGGAFWIEGTGNIVTLSNSRIAGARTSNQGGAIDLPFDNQLTVRNSVIENNSAGTTGGAIHSLGLLEIDGVRFIGNQAANGGALFNGVATSVVRSSFVSNTVTGNGGAVRNEGFLDIAASTLSGNSAGVSGGALSNTVATTLTNVTISGNTATVSGGGVHNANVSGAAVELRQVTVADNQSATGAAVSNARSLRLSRSILSGNGPSNCSGTLTDDGGNLAWGDSSCGTLPSGNPMLLALADNGGPTHTRLPGNSGAAIDGLICNGNLFFDQRGSSRPQGVRCDIGAVESVSAHNIGGTVSGLVGGSVELVINGAGNAVLVSTNGPFSFPGSLPRGADYEASVRSQPTTPAQLCTVSNGNGNVGSGPVTSITVNCILDERIFTHGFDS